ncbi:MAG: prephenate/arogenate dehydrogenase family protein [Devosiaceae bacterium]|nr:prephenate/arogenate dehydrogenase family protein [Devosiaceae bacterium]
MSIIFEKMALIGVGLIGSSIAQAARAKNIVGQISVATRRQITLDEAISINIADSYSLSSAEAVRDADLVVLCTPVGASEAIMKEIAGSLKPGAILSDVGSVKGHVQNVIGPLVPKGVHFIPGHPMAGTENSGPLSGFAELFEGRWCILTPTENTDEGALTNLKNFWIALGSQIEIMDANHHDLVVAITSHVPHLVAYNIVGTVDDMETVSKSEVIKFSAGGFRDFTRIAASDPVMWRDVFLTNREAVLEMLGRFLEDLSVLQRAVRVGDGDALEELFMRTRDIRRSIIDAGQEIDEVDFGRTNAPSKEVKREDN